MIKIIILQQLTINHKMDYLITQLIIKLIDKEFILNLS